VATFDPAVWYRPLEAEDPVHQGDLMFGITLRVVLPRNDSPGSFDIGEYTTDVIVATQSCDLEQGKVAQVEVIPVYPVAEWLAEQPLLFSQLDSIRRGYVPATYLLPGWPEAPVEAARRMRVVALDEKRSISWQEFEEARHCPRVGLVSPYIEHFGQAVARFYMRVGLPEDMPEVKWKPADDDGKGRRFTLEPESYEAMGMPRPTTSVSLTVQRMMLVDGSETLYRAALDRDGNFIGIGETSAAAIQSLQRHLLKRRGELARQPAPEGRRPHWLLELFPA
jgi:hypothetical protein